VCGWKKGKSRRREEEVVVVEEEEEESCWMEEDVGRIVRGS
jgi:hypothetical protein